MNNIVDTIIRTYVDRRSELPENKQRHFLYRAVKATGREDLSDIFLHELKPYTLKQDGAAVSAYVADQAAYLTAASKDIIKYEPRKQNDAAKKEQWLAVPSLYANHSLVWSLYYLKVFNVSTLPIKLDVEEIWQTLLANPNFLKYAPVCAINLIYHLRNLGFGDRTKELGDLFRTVFANTDPNDPVTYINYVYGLTHIVIGESNFYISTVDQAKLLWIREIFEQQQDPIYDRLTLDINAEVALCLLMLCSDAKQYIAQVEQRLVDNFVAKDGYIHREEKSTFQFAEHTNAVAILLFRFNSLNLN